MSGLHYLLLVNLYLLLFFGFYSLLLRHETFFRMNRLFLVGSGLLSFLIPLIQANFIQAWLITQKVAQMTQEVGAEIISHPLVSTTAKQQTFSTGQILFYLYLAGVTTCLFRLLWNLSKLNHTLKNPEKNQAFSFFKKINIDPALAGKNTILHHEQVHSQHWHSADILFFEFIAMINWFNPVVYLYKKAIRYIHEFTADEIAASNQGSKSEYALLLLSTNFGVRPGDLLNGFWNQSLLKRRMMMLSKTRSTKTALIKYGFTVPLFVAMLIISSAIVKQKPELMLVPQKVERALLEVSKIEVLNSAPVAKPVAHKHLPMAKIDTLKNKSEVLSQNAEFPGGTIAFFKYLGDNVKYPEEARRNNVTGKVIINFMVETDGSIRDIKVLRGIGSGLDEEAIRVIQESPKWNPMIVNGQTVRSSYTLPISFTSVFDSGNMKQQDQESAQLTIKSSELNPDKEKNVKAATIQRALASLLADNDEENSPPEPSSNKSVFTINGKTFKIPTGKMP